MQNDRLSVGDAAPDFRVMAAHNGAILEATPDSLLEGRRGLVLTSYVLDFTGG